MAMDLNDTFFSFPDEQEIKAAQAACCGRYCNACEAPAEYAWRKRSVDLSILLEAAIEAELTEIEKKIIKDFWFNSKSVTAISAERKVAPSTVSAAVDRAQNKLKKALGYTIRYQHDINSESVIPLALGRARVIAAARNASGGTTAQRIMRLRQSQNLSRKSLSKALGIPQARLESLEHGKVALDLQELTAISEFFSVSTDFILKGVDFNGKQKSL